MQSSTKPLWPTSWACHVGQSAKRFCMLDEAGLVRTEKNRGVFVRDIPIDEALEIFDLRAAMDDWVGKRLAACITPEQLKEIKTLVADMEKAVRGAGCAPVPCAEPEVS
jgi:DNA-binding GntR family transcriptional regulator